MADLAPPAPPAADTPPAEASAQPGAGAAPAPSQPSINDAMRRMVEGMRQRQVAAAATSNESDAPEASSAASATAPSSAPRSPSAASDAASTDDATDDLALTDGEAEGASDSAESAADPAKKSRRQQAEERRQAELAEMRAQLEREQSEKARLQQEAAEREQRDERSRQVVAEAIGTDEEYQQLLTRKARETDLGYLPAEDEQKLARWAANREILRPALDLTRKEGHDAGYQAGRIELLTIMDADVTKLAGELKVPVAELAKAQGFAEVVKVFHDHAAARLTAAEQRVKELTDINAQLETELSSLRAKTAGAGRLIPERGGQSSAVTAVPKRSWANARPVDKIAAGLNEQYGRRA